MGGDTVRPWTTCDLKVTAAVSCSARIRLRQRTAYEDAARVIRRRHDATVRRSAAAKKHDRRDTTMALEYGVLRAQPGQAKREDDGSTPHLQIRALDATGQPWRVAVNVQSDDRSEVVFWVVDPLVGHPILGALAG